MRSLVLTLIASMAGLFALIACIVFAASSGPPLETSIESSYMTARTIEELSEASDVVVVASFSETLAIRERDDPVNTRRGSVIRDDELSVERYLKGTGDDVIVYSLSVGMNDARRGRYMFPGQDPLEAGQRYVLFLRRTPSGGLTPTMDPWRFRLVDGAVVPESRGVLFEAEFPATEAELLSAVIETP